MRKLFAVPILGLTLALLGVSGCIKPEQPPVAEKSLLKCSTCGLEFTDPEGLKQHQKNH